MSPMLGLALAALWIATTARGAVGERFDERPVSDRYERYRGPADELYKSPVQLLLSPDGGRLYVACEGTGEVLLIDTATTAVVGHGGVERLPFGLALSPDEKSLLVGSRWENTVSELDPASLESRRGVRVGDDPHGISFDSTGERFFVANLSTNDISVVDMAEFRETRRLPAGAGPFDIAATEERRTLYVSSQYSEPVPFRTPPILELTVVDADAGLIWERRRLRSTVIGQGLAVSPDGRFVVTALEIPKNLIPETQLAQGWMVTFGIALTETRPGGRSAFLLIDEPNLYFADPYGVDFTPDGRLLFISSSGADVVTVIDVASAYERLEVRGGEIGLDDQEISRLARHLGASDSYVLARVPTGRNPKGLRVSPDGRFVYVANRLSDDITIIDTNSLEAIGSIDLGGPDTTTVLRHGAVLFNHASISFQKQLSCNTCHPEEHLDGLSYDIAVDGGMGRNLVDNRSLRGISETAPFKWTGKNPTLERQEGPRAAQLFFRTHGFVRDENTAIVRFIESIPLRPNRYRETGAALTEFQLLGKEMFEREYDNFGRYIPTANRCIGCHKPPYGTDRKRHDIGSKATHDRDGVFDTPHLSNVHQKAPYLHDGRCYSLEELWTRFNPDDTHGVTNDMTKDQLNALIEYIKSF